MESSMNVFVNVFVSGFIGCMITLLAYSYLAKMMKTTTVFTLTQMIFVAVTLALAIGLDKAFIQFGEIWQSSLFIGASTGIGLMFAAVVSRNKNQS
jgi:drug/metabolite transporter (DMT)-like permease